MAKIGEKFEELVRIVKKIRKICPWDRVQTFKSLKPYLVEEVYEAHQAIDDKDEAKLAEELGDMLLHVIMLSNMLQEKTRFSIGRVIDLIHEKMIRRHPHVFAKIKVKNADEVLARWERIKQGEVRKKGQKHKSILENVPQSLPALYRADKVQKRAARVGFDWDRVAGAWEKVHEELDEIHELLNSKLKSQKSKRHLKTQKLREEIGDLLFAIVNVARKLDIDAEEALQKANSKFMRRFSEVEKRLHKKKMTLAEMDELWNQVKAREA